MKTFNILLILFIFYGCGGNVSPIDSALESQTLLFGNGNEPQGLDPHIVTGVPEHHLLISLCEGLTIANPKGGENLPGVAESWAISEDGKTTGIIVYLKQKEIEPIFKNNKEKENYRDSIKEQNHQNILDIREIIKTYSKHIEQYRNT